MEQPDKVLLDKLGRGGLSRVLDDLLDKNRLVRLANTCGLSYPGMRTRSQTRDRLLGDLAERAEKEDATAKALFRALRKETAAQQRSWNRLSDEKKLAALDALDPGRSRKLGLHLFLLARDNGNNGLDQRLGALLDEPGVWPRAQPPAAAVKETAQLEKKFADLQKKQKAQHTRLTKSRDEQKQLKRDLIQRKGELAESRLLVSRLREQIEQFKKATPESAPPPAAEQMDKLARAVRSLTTQQRKLTHGIEKQAETVPTATLPPGSLDPLLEAIGGLQKEMAGMRRDRRKEQKDTRELLEQLGTELRSLKKVRQAATRKPRPGKGDRVGVFVDVQNMYYGARQLKGKLDFDALLQAAVRERRLIQAKAYVVESKEIDQSGFISRLQQKAFEVRRKTLKVRSDGSMKGDWDMEMALEILDAATSLDVVVLVSGDGDFTSLVNRVKRMGPRVEVIGFPRTTAKSLVESADDYQPLDRKFMIRAPARAGENGSSK